mmetsp:Transcript_6589/g.13610  ORF Transcript_6589/g.13610 Transcript_6589/m.13610 type:complete len:90 (+) Transcript_6589:673-942(+)
MFILPMFVLTLTLSVCLDDLDFMAMEYEKWNRSGSDFELMGESYGNNGNNASLGATLYLEQIMTGNNVRFRNGFFLTCLSFFFLSLRFS